VKQTEEISRYRIKTPMFRVFYAHLLAPKMDPYKKKEMFSLLANFDLNQDLSTLLVPMNEMIVERWGPKFKITPNFKSPLKDQSEEGRLKDPETGEPTDKLRNGFAKGAKCIRLSSTPDKFDPTRAVIDGVKQPVTDKSKIYNGVYAIAVINLRTFDVTGNRGISAYLEAIQITDKGVPAGGQNNVMDSFSMLEEADKGESTEDIFGLT
jgi:hypothetical protein